jgi:protein SCO1/2
MAVKNNKYSLGKAITLVLILLIPGLLHLYLRQTGENIYKSLPYLGNEAVGSIKQVQSFELLNQDNEIINFPERPSITVVNFMHTDCEVFGGMMELAMDKVAKKFGKHQMVNLYSISLDSNDTPAVLKTLSNKYHAKETNWQFLTGSESETSRIAKQEFMLDGFRDTLNSDRIIHSPFLVLLDSKQQIRGYYEFYTKDEVDRLVGEMILLITEDSKEKRNE